MNANLKELVEISQYYGRQMEYVIAGGGNTSFKTNDHIWVKASGTTLADIKEEGFAALDRKILQEIYAKKYSSDTVTREAEVKADLYRALLPGVTVRPSVETSLHEIINYAYIVHTHPTLVNAVLCSNRAAETIRELFGEDALFVPYTDPGYILFSKIKRMLEDWRKTHTEDPRMIFLENHGVFVSANTTSEIKGLYDKINGAIEKKVIKPLPGGSAEEIRHDLAAFMPALRMMLSDNQIKVARIMVSPLSKHFTQNEGMFTKIAAPFTPDQIVYCKAKPVFLEQQEPEAIVKECRDKIAQYRSENGYDPKVFGLKNSGILAVEDTPKAVDTVHEVFEDWMKISWLSESFGGPQFMTEQAIEFIDNWEVENYRRQVAKAGIQKGRVENKIVVITGGAQGFGAGIAREMMSGNANVVIADLNEEKGTGLANELNSAGGKNKAIFVNTDVSKPASVENLIYQTVKHFGGLDVFISNAGILRAGGLDEMTADTFELMTRVNYQAYFLCAKYASSPMKLQSTHHPGCFSDIIQINSKSGLKGSNKNFAYAGGKFGGIGLTQSFALELMPYRIKVNSICPGNFFEGPLWSDPDTGLFVQYLKAGKVPGAKTIEDVKAYYEKQVPAGRGCRIGDVMSAIYYVIEQVYETGQAIPVTGGQEMLN